MIATATMTQSLWALVGLAALAELTNRLVCRAVGIVDAPRSYVWFAGIVLLARIGVRLIFGVWPITLAEFLAATTEGLRLVAILFAVAMASTLANPRALLRVAPNGLYEVATAAVVALNLAPQIGPSLLRVRRAAALRGRSRGLGSFAAIVIPTLEDSLEQSLALAASMESRGFGARGAGELATEAVRRQRLCGALMVVGLAGIAAGAISLVSFGTSWLTLGLAVFGLLTLTFGLRGRRTGFKRSRFERLSFGVGDALALTTCLVICLACIALPAVTS
ncbi:MAG: hypothetical protein RLZ88_501 [Actinomycetota bacterium]